MLNHIVIMGRLVADPELRTTPSGIMVSTLRLAVDRDFKNKQTGERETDFINVVAWRQTAEFVTRFFSKGRMAVVEGRLQIRQYTDKENNKRSIAEVVAENIYFGDSRRDGDGGNYPRPNAAPQQSQSGYAHPAPAAEHTPAAGSSYPHLPTAETTAPVYSAAESTPAGGYPPPSEADRFSELSDDDDGELPF